MKSIRYMLFLLAAMLLVNGCKDEDPSLGNPSMDFKTQISDAYYGDSLAFTINATDTDVPLSTLKAQLYYGEEMVSETVIRTKTLGQDYNGKIYVPYMANIPNGTATLKFLLQNIQFTIEEREFDLTVSRPDFPYLTLVTDNGEYQMKRTGLYEYAITQKFTQKVKGYIKSPKMGENGNELYFGWNSNAVVEGTTNAITFSNAKAGKYTIAFNSYTYSASPFVKLLVNNVEMESVDDNNYKIDVALSQNQTVAISGIPNFSDWSIDSDFFEKQADGTLKFLSVSGQYRITANFSTKYLVVEALNGSDYATLQSDGSGAIWIIGEGIGKPSVSSNEIGWNTDKALCMSQISAKKYQITLVAGKSLNAGNINFKFFHQKGWGGEFSNADLSTSSSIVFVGDNTNGRDSGNLGIIEGASFEAGYIYRFIVDVTAGIDQAVLTVEKLGEEQEPVRSAAIGGVALSKVVTDNYAADMNLVQGQVLELGGDLNTTEWWIDPDYFSVNGSSLTFIPLSGKYRVTADYANKYLKVEVLAGSDMASLQADGSGAVWIIGDGIGKPSLDNAVGWNTDKAICMAPIASGKYRVTLIADEQVSESNINFKFFYQKGWGKEFGSAALSTSSTVVYVGDGTNGRDSGNLGIVEGRPLKSDASYQFTLDVTAGIDNAVLTIEEMAE